MLRAKAAQGFLHIFFTAIISFLPCFSISQVALPSFYFTGIYRK
jgi:TM2 domain-containing membrane protein YozV